MCQTLRAQGRFWDLENLLSTSTGAYTPDDRRSIFMYTLMSYADQCQYDRAMNLWQQLQAEGLASDFPQFHALMAQLAASVATSASSMSTEVTPSDVAPTDTPTYAVSEAGSSGVASSVAVAKSSQESTTSVSRPSCPPTPASSVATTTTTTKEATVCKNNKRKSL